MTQEKHQRELLSAYLDGELSAEERLRAEQLLENSVGARREIDEFAELSELVRSLPAVSAPPELLPAILRRAERETLLPPAQEQPAAAANAPAVAVDVATKRRRARLAAAATLAATAAAIVVTIQWLPQWTSDPADATVAEHRSASPAGAYSADARNHRVALQSTPATSAARMDAADAAPEAALAGDSSASSGGADPALKRETPGAASGEGRIAGGPRLRSSVGSTESANALSLDADALEHVQPGDVLQYFDTTDTKVTTYVVTVVDVTQALNQMQVLLARNDIPARMTPAARDEAAERAPATGEDKRRRNADRDGDAAEKSPDVAQSGRLFAVYVETTPDRFTSALRDLLHDEQFAQLQPKPPVDEGQIEIAETGQSRRQLFEQERASFGRRKQPDKEQAFADGDTAPAKAKATDKPAAPSAPPADRKPRLPADARSQAKAVQTARPAAADEKQERKDDALRGPGKGRAREDLSDAPSFQLRVQLAPLAEPAQRQQVAGNRGTAAEEPAASAPAESPEKRQAAEADVHPAEEEPAAPVRVLFVFREAPKPTQQP
jgi:hypothetical protein